MKFKTGDFVKVKEGVKLESGEAISNWAGEIIETYPEEKTCLVELDSITLNQMDDQYLLVCIEEGAEPYEYIFYEADLIKSSRRDSDEELSMAREIMDVRIIEMYEDDGEELDKIVWGDWISEFESSDFFTGLNDYQKENAAFIADTFMNYMDDYIGVMPGEWSSSDIKEVCLDIVPRKISSEIELFENYGDVLLQFVKFLEEVDYIPKSKEIQDTIISIKDQIPEKAKDPANWGMAKSMMMGVQESGYDVSDQAELDAYIMDYNRQIASDLAKTPSNNRIRPARENPFKKIGRNQRITVKYSDGTIKENIKFKKVQQDLLDGKCELIRK